jgi:hypothetical protein
LLQQPEEVTMDTFIASLTSQIDDEVKGGVADALGISTETASTALASAAPAVLAALSEKAGQPAAAADLMRTFDILTSTGKSQPFTMLRGMLSDPKAMSAGVNMAHSVLGNQFGPAVEHLMAKAGVSEATAEQVLGMITPAIMGAVATQARQGGVDASGLSALFDQAGDGIAAPAVVAGITAPQSIAAPVVAQPAVTPPVAPVVSKPAATAPAATTPSAPADSAALSDLNMDAEAATALAAKIGLPEGTVQQLAPVVIGFVLAALGRKAKQPDGLKQIGALIEMADATGITRMSAAEYVKQADPAKNADVLGTLIGENTLENVADNFGRKMGVTSEQAAGLLGVGVPVVLGQLGRMQNALGTNTEGLAKYITEKAAGIKNPGEMEYILENTPGISDNVKRGLRKLFGRS